MRLLDGASMLRTLPWSETQTLKNVAPEPLEKQLWMVVDAGTRRALALSEVVGPAPRAGANWVRTSPVRPEMTSKARRSVRGDGIACPPFMFGRRSSLATRGVPGCIT